MAVEFPERFPLALLHEMADPSPFAGRHFSGMLSFCHWSRGGRAMLGEASRPFTREGRATLTVVHTESAQLLPCSWPPSWWEQPEAA